MSATNPASEPSIHRLQSLQTRRWTLLVKGGRTPHQRLDIRFESKKRCVKGSFRLCIALLTRCGQENEAHGREEWSSSCSMSKGPRGRYRPISILRSDEVVKITDGTNNRLMHSVTLRRQSEVASPMSGNHVDAGWPMLLPTLRVSLSSSMHTAVGWRCTIHT
jgi:hypothetical protein